MTHFLWLNNRDSNSDSSNSDSSNSDSINSDSSNSDSCNSVGSFVTKVLWLKFCDKNL